MYTAEQRITMVKYILHVFEEASLQISFTAFANGNNEEAKEYGIKAGMYKETLSLFTDDNQLEKVFSMAQSIGEKMGANISLLINKIKEYELEGDEEDV